MMRGEEVDERQAGMKVTFFFVFGDFLFWVFTCVHLQRLLEVSRRWSWVCLEIMKSLWEAPSQAVLALVVLETYSLHDAGRDASSRSLASWRHSVWEIFICVFSDIYARRVDLTATTQSSSGLAQKQ